MGSITTKCLEVLDQNRIFDINKDDNDNENDLNKDKIPNSSKNKYHKKNSFNINDIIISTKTIQNNLNDNNKNNNRIGLDEEGSIDISKIKKIQNAYHKHFLKKTFETKIKPSLSQKTYFLPRS